MSDLVGNPEDRFSHNKAQIMFMFQEYTKRVKSGPLPPDETWELVEQPSDHDSKCECRKNTRKVG